MIAELSAAMAALKETAGLVKAISDAKTDADVKAATFELQSKLLTLQSDCFALGDVIRTRDEEIVHLKAEIADFEDFKRQTEGYILNKFDSGSFVYSKKQIVNNTEVTVHLCPNCFVRREISILQPSENQFFNAETEQYFSQCNCHSCNSVFAMNRSSYKPMSGFMVSTF